MVTWKTDFDKFVILGNFERRGWTKAAEEDAAGWDIYWANVTSVRAIFATENNARLKPGQLINHFPNHYELTRKDLLAKNVKRYQRAARKRGIDITGPAHNFLPVTYVLPQDYALFVEEFRRSSTPTWIMKPASKAQGKGIFLINKLSQVKKWANSGAAVAPALRGTMENYVISRYIDNPLLIGGKKFDLRLYVVVTSYSPLKAYMSSLGFARFCSEKYSTEVAELENMFVHLTNVAIQKHGEEYNESHGNKWALRDVRLYLEGVHGHEATAALFDAISALAVGSLRACQPVMINDKHCFELYGYDVIVDDCLKPWLVEVNASPSLTTTTKADRMLKFKVINDTLDIVTPSKWEVNNSQYNFPARPPGHKGSMFLLVDEGAQ